MHFFYFHVVKFLPSTWNYPPAWRSLDIFSVSTVLIWKKQSEIEALITSCFVEKQAQHGPDRVKTESARPGSDRWAGRPLEAYNPSLVDSLGVNVCRSVMSIEVHVGPFKDLYKSALWAHLYVQSVIFWIEFFSLNSLRLSQVLSLYCFTVFVFSIAI